MQGRLTEDLRPETWVSLLVPLSRALSCLFLPSQRPHPGKPTHTHAHTVTNTCHNAALPPVKAVDATAQMPPIPSVGAVPASMEQPGCAHPR